MGVSTSSASAAGARAGDTKIVAQGQTAGDYGNDPYMQTRQSRDKTPQTLRPS